jgi:hypothetical protein
MPRQRFIHPDFWIDPTIGKLAAVERLFFIGCFSNADDEGRLLGDPAYLRSVIFPYDDIKIADVEKMRDRVVSTCRNLVHYTVNGTSYLAFRHWSRYQAPRYPKPSKLPMPPDDFTADVHPDSDNIATKSPQACNQIDESMSLSGVTGFGYGMGREWDGNGMGMGDEPAQTRTTGKKKPLAPKHSFAEFVSLTNDEHSSLVAKYGEAGTLRIIEILDNYKGSTGKTYKSDYRTILNWVVQRYEDERSKTPTGKYAPNVEAALRLVKKYEEDDALEEGRNRQTAGSYSSGIPDSL